MFTAEEYFKSKINWKFFNFLKDKLTKYEDDGYEFNVNARIYWQDKYELNITVFAYQTNVGERYSEYVDKSILEKHIVKYLENGLSYYIGQVNDKPRILNEYYIEIKNKSTKQFINSNIYSIIVKPK